MKAITLAIGSEITAGQINNSNASWISSQLQKLGIKTQWQLSVPDDFDLILQALNLAEAQADLLFITGGLGPTSDDFTRDVVAHWAQSKMIFDDESWQMLSERLTLRGYTVKEIQKQQCYFPEDARILKNSEGTANGFYLKKNNLHVFVLPGPPREVHAVWKYGIQTSLEEMAKNLDRSITYSWDTLGVGESDVAIKTESVIAQFPQLKNKIEIGYRVHLPYVEVKLTYNSSLALEVQDLQKQLDTILDPITITRDGLDILQKLTEQLKSYSHVSIVDSATGHFLIQKIAPQLRSLGVSTKISLSQFEIAETTETTKTLELRIEKIAENEVIISLHKNNHTNKKHFNSPHSSPLMAERRSQYFAEQALIQWSQWLQ